MPPSGRRRDASIAELVRSLSRADVATRLSSRTTPPARTRRDNNAVETLELTSGVAFATIAASRTSSEERPAGSGCTRTRTPGFAAFHAAVTRMARLGSVGVAAGQYVTLLGAGRL